MAEDAATDAAMMATNEHTKLDTAVGALLAGLVRHPVLLQVRVGVLHE